MEIVVTGADSNTSDSFLSVSDLHTGSHLLSFKQSHCSKNAAICVNNVLIVAQNDNAVLNVYRWHKEGFDQKLLVPEKLDVLCSSHSGTWLAGGSASGKIYLWELASGSLLFVKEAHYQGLSALAFSQDDLVLVSGSSDTTVKVWSIVDALDPQSPQDLLRPRHNLSQHTRAVTGLHIGTGSSVSARLFTVSSDQTVKIWDLATGDLLTTLLLPNAVTSLAVDPLERFIYAGTSDGLIHELRLYKQDKVIQAIGGMGAIVNAGHSEGSAFVGHDSPISALSLSADGGLLTSGADDGNVYTWDVSSKQMIRKLKRQSSMVSVLITSVRPAGQPVGLKSQNNQLPQLKRAQAERDRDEHNVHVRLLGNVSADVERYEPMSDFEAINIGLGQIVNPPIDPAAQEIVTKLRDELTKLHGMYSSLRVERDRLQNDLISSQI